MPPGKRKGPPGIEGKMPDRDQEISSEAREREQGLSHALHSGSSPRDREETPEKAQSRGSGTMFTSRNF